MKARLDHTRWKKMELRRESLASPFCEIKLSAFQSWPVAYEGWNERLLKKRPALTPVTPAEEENPNAWQTNLSSIHDASARAQCHM